MADCGPKKCIYLRSRNKPMIANAIPAILCHDGGSRKNRIPAMAMIAAPPAKIAGTDESWTSFLEKEEECNCACTYTDSGKDGIKNSVCTGLLVPTSRQPEKHEVK